MALPAQLNVRSYKFTAKVYTCSEARITLLFFVYGYYILHITWLHVSEIPSIFRLR